MTDSVDLEHSSAHSLNYGSDFKEIHCSQQHSIAKLNRNDLEDLYYQLHDENIEIKKKFNSLDSKYKIMATRVMRLSRDHKCLDSIDREEDQRQLQQLRQNEAALRAKLTVLRGQLASHTRLHSGALSKMQRPRAHRCSRSCHTGHHSSCGGDDELLLDTSRTGSQSRGQSRPRSSSRSGVHTLGGPVPSKDQSELRKTNAALREEVVGLEERINVLQKDMQLASEQSHSRIAELEAELGKHIAQETAENIDLIRARRTNKQQEAVIMSLQHDHQVTQRELQACKAALALAARDQEEMCSTLMRERQKNTELQQEIVALSQTCSSTREIQEQLDDVKKENAILKEHSNRLLQLTTVGTSDVQSGHKDDLMQVKQNLITPQHHSQDSTAIPEESSSSEQEIIILRQQQSHLVQEFKDIQDEITALHKKISDAIQERDKLKDEHIKVHNECSKLRKELTEPYEERRKLAQQVEEVQGECARLTDELAKSKSELLQQQQQQDLYQTVQERRVFQERVSAGDQTSPQPISPVRPVFHTPQLSARPGQYMSTLQSHSHPSTPRPRVGDACLALLEQSAIRPSPNSFHGVLSSHGSLQEKFLELCIPTGSISATSTPIPPPSVDEGRSPSKNIPSATLPLSEDAQQKFSTTADQAIHPGVGIRVQQTTAQTDTQWELEKCRELLRRQFNLNSIYKKEVASLNNIVQSLTSGAQGGSK